MKTEHFLQQNECSFGMYTDLLQCKLNYYSENTEREKGKRTTVFTIRQVCTVSGLSLL